MSTTRYRDEEVVEILRNVDRMFGERISITDICRSQGISRSTLYRWQRRYDSPPQRRVARSRNGPAVDPEKAQNARVAALENDLRTRDVQINALRVVAEGN